MTYFEALYGSQYYEITNKGKDGASGRLNGNLFLSAFVIICILLVIAVLLTISDDFTNEANHLFHKLFGYSSGKMIGKLLAIPLLGIIYFAIAKTIGSAANYDRITKSFMEYPEEEKQKANMKILKPFFTVLGLLFVLMMLSLFRS
jgi:hypothetical protein